MDRDFTAVQRWLFAGVATVAVAVRLPQLWAGASVDEAATLWTTTQPWADALTWIVQVDTHPPAHYLLARLAPASPPLDLVFLRSVSLVLGLATVALGWRATRRLATPRAGAFAAALLALSPGLVHFSAVGRMYALLAFAAAVAFDGGVRHLEADGPKQRLLGLVELVSGVTLALYTHNTGFLVGAALALWLAAELWRRGAPGRRWAELLGAAVVVALLWTPWLLVLGTQTTTFDDHWINDRSIERLVNSLRYSWSGARPGLSLQFVAIDLAVVGLGLVALRRRQWLGLSPALAAGVAIGAAWLVGLVWHPILIVRIILWTAVPVAAGLAVILDGLDGRRGRAVLAVMLATNLALLTGGFRGGGVEPIDSLLAHVDAVGGGLLLVLPNAPLWQLDRWNSRHGTGRTDVRPFPGSPAQEWDWRVEAADERVLDTLLGDREQLWLIHNVGKFPSDPPQVIAWLEARFEACRFVQRSGGEVLLHFGPATDRTAAAACPIPRDGVVGQGLAAPG